ncbi:MAG: PAS domain-containing sensor histidine kinase [Burkholderiaceae bacterium]
MKGGGQQLLAIDRLYEQAACGLMVTAEDGTILRVNQTFCAWLGFNADELVGHRRMQSLLTMGARIFHQTHWVPLLQMQGSVSEVKLEIVHKDGHRIPIVINARRRADADGVVDEIAAFVAKDRHTYERELIGARKFAEQMMGIVSHDLRNPLSIILMNCSVMLRGDPQSPHRPAVERMTRAARLANRLIADLLDFTAARIGRGLSIQPRPIELHQAVAHALDDLRTAFAQHELLHQAHGMGSCTADSDRIAQLLGNLVANAAAYGAPDRPVTIDSRVANGQCQLSVHNEGAPIPAEHLASLFEPMTQGDGTPAQRSVGLGLFIVREIARAHGGEVQVESSAASGTRFTFTFPCRTQ